MKRVLCLTIALILALNMLPMLVFAADSFTLGVSGSADTTYGVGTVRPNTSIRLDIQKNGGTVTRQMVRDDKLDVKIKTVSGSKVIKDVALAYDGETAYVKIEFVQYHLSTKEEDFEIQVYLTQNKNKLNDTILTVFGTMENHILYVDDRDDYVYLRDYPVVEARDYIKDIRVDLGAGIVINTRMYQDKRYYGAVTQIPTSADEDIMNKYPAIDTVFNLTTINLNSSGNRTDINFSSGKYYVYNSGMEYIGTSDEKLPYSTKYYLASQQLDVDPGDVTPSTPLPDDDDIPNNNNNGPDADGNGNVGNIGGDTNPNTGVNGYAEVAAVTGMIALAVAGAAALKRRK